MNAKALNLERNPLTWLLLAAALAVAPCWPVPVLTWVPPTGATYMASKPKITEKSKHLDKYGRPIPLEHFENDVPFNPNVDKSADKELRERIAETMKKARGK